MISWTTLNKPRETIKDSIYLRPSQLLVRKRYKIVHIFHPLWETLNKNKFKK